jgi:hypothetical protein
MKALMAVIGILGLSAWFVVHSQSDGRSDQDQALRKLALVSDVKNLAIEIPRLDGVLARSLAKAEIGDAAWTLDREWAKNILREAYQLTYPTEEEQNQLQSARRGAAPRQPSDLERARSDVRARILRVARRDKIFADKLIVDGSTHLAKDDRQLMHAQLAQMALDEGDNKAASLSIEQSIRVDPTQIAFVGLVNELAIKDRAAADKLILECMAELLTIPLSTRDMSFGRADLMLRWLVSPNSIFPDPNKHIPNPGPEVMRAYVSYIIESLGAIEQREPGSLQILRGTLLSAWIPLNAYAPELKGRFMQLEGLSRTPGKDASLPTQSNEDSDKNRFRKRDNDALNRDEPNDLSISSAIAREEFETARKLISKLPDGGRKTNFDEQVNAKEARSLAKKGKLPEAQSLAERLTRASSILEAYTLIIQQYAVNKDQIGAAAVVRQAVRQLKNADTKPPDTQPFGTPPSLASRAGGADPILWSLGKLAKAVLTVDGLVASEIVDEFVTRANTSQMDTNQGGIGFDSDLFKNLAAKDEVRARSAAENFKDPLQRIVALAAIYQWDAKALETQEKVRQTERQTPR